MYKLIIRHAEREFEEQSIKTNNHHFFKYFQSRKPAREAVQPLDDQGIKGSLKKYGEMTAKPSELFASVFPVESTGTYQATALIFRRGV